MITFKIVLMIILFKYLNEIAPACLATRSVLLLIARTTKFMPFNFDSELRMWQ